jgi:hypothetical protein
MAAQPETDYDFRQRIMRVAEEVDRPMISLALKRDLDVIGRRYGRFRYGVALAET